MTLVVYGIKNCDSMRKARAWLKAHDVPYEFHDYKKLGAGLELLQRWATRVGWERLLNRAGTTFRQLKHSDKIDLDAGKAVALMAAQPTLIRRPVVEGNGKVIIGFHAEQYAAEFG